MLIIIRNFIKHVTKSHIQWLQNYINHQHSKIIGKKTGLILHEFFLVKSGCLLIITTSQSSRAISSVTQTAMPPDINSSSLICSFQNPSFLLGDTGRPVLFQSSYLLFSTCTSIMSSSETHSLASLNKHPWIIKNG